MAKSFRCRLVTPTASVFDESVAYASVPAWDGPKEERIPGKPPTSFTSAPGTASCITLKSWQRRVANAAGTVATTHNTAVTTAATTGERGNVDG